jgi:hypothetical protein
MYYKLKPRAGSHSERGEDGNPVVFTAEQGHVFETDNDLCAMFPNKFDRVEVGPDKTASPTSSVGGKADSGPPQKETKAPSPSPFGVDVTDKYPSAGKDDLRVFQDGDAFTVVEADDPENALNANPLKKDGKGGVEAFVKKYVSE